MRIAKATGVASHWLLSGDGEMVPAEQHKSKIIPLPTSRYKKVELVSLPLLASVPAGALSQRFSFPIKPTDTSRWDDVRDPNAFRT